ncbi:hypothetical protein BV22DRAFT_1105190 [Leucogyrophana mollusca]|uniref:Uncharacterized protein n=1 Tax=Leucogyrophana mollusca TaxID=85980 RepID=A0ACB8BGM4_9AGAM|nr:hypothetical protein BV22DRAFT_1105190 [Leucogyrophana mollusca]
MKALNTGVNSARGGHMNIRGRKPQSNSAPYGGGSTPKHPLTHFISLPIGHHALLRDSISAFTGGLLQSAAPLPGLDKSIVIAPRRLHFTLGVMSLVDPAKTGHAVSSGMKTLPDALSLLSTLKPRIIELMQSHPLRVPLNSMNIMKPDGGDPDKAHVLWLGPDFNTDDARRLKAVGELVNKAFVDSGFVLDRRPLKLHCTVINTSHRRPRPKGARQPFSYKALLTSTGGQAILRQPSGQLDYCHPVKVDFGSWEVDEVQICEMGSCGPEGEYVSCGGCSLVP